MDEDFLDTKDKLFARTDLNLTTASNIIIEASSYY